MRRRWARILQEIQRPFVTGNSLFTLAPCRRARAIRRCSFSRAFGVVGLRTSGQLRRVIRNFSALEPLCDGSTRTDNDLFILYTPFYRTAGIGSRKRCGAGIPASGKFRNNNFTSHGAARMVRSSKQAEPPGTERSIHFPGPFTPC